MLIPSFLPHRTPPEEGPEPLWALLLGRLNDIQHVRVERL